MAAELIHGDCLQVLAAMAAAGRTVDAIVTDPPYGWGFMGSKWDAPDNIAFDPQTWRLALDLLEPGGMMACFGGSRTHHRLACAIEDAGFEIRDCVLWIYGSGMPKSRSLLKPSYEPIVLARKPGPLRPLGIDACRVAVEDADYAKNCSGDRGHAENRSRDMAFRMGCGTASAIGRWPPNVLTDGSAEVLGAFAAFGTSRSGAKGTKRAPHEAWREMEGRADRPAEGGVRTAHGDTGSAARFYPALGYSDDELRFMYASKASKRERQGANHPTIKPLALMRWLVRLITPPGGTVLDMFSGSGTTGLACQREGFDCVLVEREAEYVSMIRRRLGLDFNLEAAD